MFSLGNFNYEIIVAQTAREDECDIGETQSIAKTFSTVIASSVLPYFSDRDGASSAAVVSRF